MPRINKRPANLLACSPAMLAMALQVRNEEVEEYIRDGLPVFIVGKRRRIFVHQAIAFCKRRWRKS